MSLHPAKNFRENTEIDFKLVKYISKWWFQTCFNFTPATWGNDPIWRAYFSDGLVQPPTSQSLTGPGQGGQPLTQQWFSNALGMWVENPWMGFNGADNIFPYFSHLHSFTQPKTQCWTDFCLTIWTKKPATAHFRTIVSKSSVVWFFKIVWLSVDFVWKSLF